MWNFVRNSPLWTAMLAGVWTMKYVAKKANCWYLSFPRAILNSSIQFVNFRCGETITPQVHKALSTMAAWNHFGSLCLSSHYHHVSPCKPWFWLSGSPARCPCATWPCSGKAIGPYQGLPGKNIGGPSAYVSCKSGHETGFGPLGQKKAV